MSAQRILVTNDDGVGTRGLETLVAAVSDGRADVVVAVPGKDFSAMGTALGLTPDTSVEARLCESVWFCGREVVTYEVDAYPAAIVTLAMLGAFGPPPDLVLVGINHGSNVGPGLLHSSTVGAALTAILYDVRAVAFSVSSGDVDWPAIRATVTRLIDAVPDEWPARGMLNVNMPCLPGGQLPEAVWCQVSGPTAAGDLVRTRSADGGTLTLSVSYRPMTETHPCHSDFGALMQGRVALSWITLPYGADAGVPWQSDLAAKFI